jgi:hypothetical protein
MSMDDQYRQMRIFTDELRNFNVRLLSSVKDMEKYHEVVSPVWQDEMRKTYDALWGPFKDMMDNYLHNEAPRYIEFLETKARALERYLYGG